MNPSRTWRAAGPALASASLLAALTFGGCSSSDSNPVPVYHLGADGGDATHRTDAPIGTPTDAAHDGAPDVATVSHDSSLPTDGAPPADALIDVFVVDGHVVDAAVCQTTDGGCYKCTPTTTPEFLNQCTASTCAPFDNATRLPAYDGGLAPLGS